MSPPTRGVSTRPPFWLRMSVRTGNLLQLAEAGLGVALIRQATHGRATRPRRISLMLAGSSAIYFSTHAIAHWATGQAAGIGFKGYGLRGTDHPQVYPPGVRQLMSMMPFFTAVTDRRDLRRASPAARAAMLSAGQASTTIWLLLVAWYARQSGMPEGRTFFRSITGYALFLAVVNAAVPEGDFARAWAALRSKERLDAGEAPVPEQDGHRLNGAHKR